MNRKRLLLLTTVPLGLNLMLAAAPALANNCEAISAQIDAKLRKGGLQQFTLVTVETAASAAGRQMGSCDRGSRKILYRAGAAEPAATSAARRANENILTECKDGTVSMGGNCRR